MTKFYAGIGSRETPLEVQDEMARIAERLYHYGFYLRSGGADGADSAFERGCPGGRIYLPWAGFNGRQRGIVCGDDPNLLYKASIYHPAWNRCGQGARKLHARNVAQILGYGPEQQRSLFVVCWTKDAKGEGGTGQALRIARAYEVPIYDLADPAQRSAFYQEQPV